MQRILIDRGKWIGGNHRSDAYWRPCNTHTPFGLSLSKPHPARPFDKLRANGFMENT
jgi:hypothetical protein